MLGSSEDGRPEEGARASSAYTARNMRSTVTMMKYLVRTTSEGELGKVIKQNALCEGSLAERRRRQGKLRIEQEEMQMEMASQMASLASNLQADAQAKALAKARAAAKVRQMNASAEQAARMLGAVAPHRAAARDAALSVVAPLETWTVQQSQTLAGGHSPSAARGGDAAGAPELSGCLAVRPGKYCLRTGVPHVPGATDTALEPTFLAYMGTPGAMSLVGCGSEQAVAAPWTVRQPSGHRACTFATSSGAKLWCSAGGVMGVGEPPRAELAQFVVIPYYGGGETARGSPGGRSTDMRSPRPFSSAPRVSGGGGGVGVVAPTAAAMTTSPRPQTALPTGSADSNARVHVRLYHQASRRFVHVDQHTGAASTRHTDSDAPSGLVFELLQQQALPQRFVKGIAPPVPRSKLSSRGSARPSSSTRPAHGQSLPMRGFDMATGAVQDPGPSDPLMTLLPKAWGAYTPPDTAVPLAAPASVPPFVQVGAARPGPPAKAAPPPAANRRVAPPQDETRATGWEPSQLDLSDVLASGPIRLSSLFSVGGGGGMREPTAAPLGAARRPVYPDSRAATPGHMQVPSVLRAPAQRGPVALEAPRTSSLKSGAARNRFQVRAPSI